MFFSYVARHLPAGGFDVYGLSSICSSYPLTLRLAQEIRKLNPHARIILGGPQASVVDVATMHAFPCIDIIVRGEADDTFPALLQRLDNQLPEWEKLPGITFRRGDEVIRNPNARRKSPATMVGDMASLQKKYGLNYFSLVHDMYTIDRKKVVAFCEEILASGEKFAMSNFSFPPKANNTQQPWPPDSTRDVL
ncbi:MAG TPA: cobalamin-dependent protein [Pyrinomonadaceae bacterium]|nr:cobalamin-dependent protein [Pyrinomonadaceae bacterium]